jgi:predicted metal-dependent peptidase
MSDEDIANGCKELQAVAAIQDSEGWIVPMDAKAYWDSKVRISTTSDVKRTKIVGRGGTVFNDFFENLAKEIGNDLDVVVIITDGDCGAHEMPANLRPPCDVLWIITNKREFKPAFGRVIQLNQVRH